MRNGIYEVERLEMRFLPQESNCSWPWAEREAARIDAHWRAQLAAKPKLFDGQVLLMRAPEIRDGILRGDYFLTNFRNFLSWRDFGFPDTSVYNCFSMAALRSRDGAWLLGEMGPHTATAGKIYFAAGTPDRNDIVGERVDLKASVSREMTEETGFADHEAPPSPGFRLVVEGQKIACMQERRLDLTADEALARVSAFLAADPDPELARLVAVRGAAEIDAQAMPDFIVTYLLDAFATAG